MAVPSEPPVDDIAGLFAIERDRLLGLLGGLPTEDWLRESPCPGWSVLGLAGHLLGDDLGLLSRRRDGHHGTPPPEGRSEAGFIDWLDELQVEWVRAARRISPRLVVELLGWTGPRLVEVFGREDPRERSAQVSWAGPDPVPRWLDQLRELSEYWIHRQQLHDALGLPADLDPTLLRPVLLGLRWALPYRLIRAEVVVDGAIEVRVGDPIDERWTLVRTADGVWSFADTADEPVATSVALTADTAWRQLTGNLRPESTPPDVAGDQRPRPVVLATRAIIGHPD